ncbi:MAG: hypothetical protein V9F01_16750 [Chitinophagaceae bacterium]
MGVLGFHGIGHTGYFIFYDDIKMADGKSGCQIDRKINLSLTKTSTMKKGFSFAVAVCLMTATFAQSDKVH